jgi:hypothetical protein
MELDHLLNTFKKKYEFSKLKNSPNSEPLHLKHFDYRLRCKSKRLATEICKVTVSTSEFAKFSTTKNAFNELTFDEKKNTFHQMHLMKSQFDHPCIKLQN